MSICSQATCVKEEDGTTANPKFRPWDSLPSQEALALISPAPVVSSTGSREHRLMYISPCGLWSQSHPTFKPVQTARATGNGQGCIYSHTVFIQRCCFAQITMSFLHRIGHNSLFFPRVSRGTCKMNPSPGEGRGTLHPLFSSFLCEKCTVLCKGFLGVFSRGQGGWGSTKSDPLGKPFILQTGSLQAH